MNAPMSPYFALFNQHINNAGKRANRDVIQKYGRDTFMQYFPKAYRSGIMGQTSIPDEIAQFYLDRVTTYVNEETP